MKRADFEHVIRAAVDVVGDDVVVIGSQAVLGSHPNAPRSLLTSLELDMYPLTKPERSHDIDGSLGDGSPFHESFGYYAHGVGPETHKAPAGWQDRLVRVEVQAAQPRQAVAVAWCLETHDLVLAKIAAGRAHDYEFAETAIRERLVDVVELKRRAELMAEEQRDITLKRLSGLLSKIRRSDEPPIS